MTLALFFKLSIPLKINSNTALNRICSFLKENFLYDYRLENSSEKMW